jgi:type I restriction enzyme R subunit
VKFNEDSRVKIPAILHLTRLGYTYLSLKGLEWDESSNIVPSLFCQSVSAINPTATPSEIEAALAHLDLHIDNEDLGKQFYEKITQTSGLKIIDFEDVDRNSFHVVTEFPCKNGDEEFRPDITLLINGLPLVFIEVKKPNNRDGILAERSRFHPSAFASPATNHCITPRSGKARRRFATAAASPIQNPPSC